MKLSVALIVRNEASEIEGCLSTIAGADEIVIVDTGSNDDTVSIAQEWAKARGYKKLKVRRTTWNDNFSEARNFASAECSKSSSWILHIDADMRMLEGGIEKLKAALSEAKGKRTAAIWQQSISGGVRNLRVMCHRHGVKWCFPIHEALEFDEGVVVEDVTVLYGWSDSHKEDPERNLRILRKASFLEPSPRIFYYLGSELFTLKRFDEALGWFERCVEASEWRSERADAWLFIAKIKWAKGRGDEARESVMKCLLNTPDCKEALELIASMCWEDEARHWLKYAQVAGNSKVIFSRSAALPAGPSAEEVRPRKTGGRKTSRRGNAKRKLQ